MWPQNKLLLLHPPAAGFLPPFCPPRSFFSELARGWTTSPLPWELGITGPSFLKPFFPFPEKPVSHDCAPLLSLAPLGWGGRDMFWNTTDAVGRSDVMASPKWAEFVLLNINFAHHCDSPSVSQLPTMTLLQSSWLVTVVPCVHQDMLPPCSTSPPPHTFQHFPLLQVPQQPSHQLLHC